MTPDDWFVYSHRAFGTSNARLSFGQAAMRKSNMNTLGLRVIGRWGMAVCLLGIVLLVGCGGSLKLATGKVSGKVTHNGQPVTGGTITLVPIAKKDVKEAGLSARCAIQSDGTFKASTYGQFDGAVIGKHTVVFSPPSVETPVVADGAHAQTPPPQYAGLTNDVTNFEVKAGDNTIDIKLIPSGGGGAAAASGTGTPAAAHAQ